MPICAHTYVLVVEALGDVAIYTEAANNANPATAPGGASDVAAAADATLAPGAQVCATTAAAAADVGGR